MKFFRGGSERSGELELIVSNINYKEAYKGIVRIDDVAMGKLGVRPGDVVMIVGRRRAVAVAMPGYSEDRGSGLIRMDETTRKNVGVEFGEAVRVSKVRAEPAKMAVLAPVSLTLAVDENFAQYVKKRLIGRAVLEGNVVRIPVLGQAIPFKVILTKPSGPVTITDDTRVLLREKAELPRPKGYPASFEELRGFKRVKRILYEAVVRPLKYPEYFRKMGVKPPKGVLLYGPPGCGKSLLAFAAANECDAQLIVLSGFEILSGFHSLEGSRALKDVFREAEEYSPSVVFIDDLDVVAPRREYAGDAGRWALSLLLTLMDRLESDGVVVIGSTSRPDAVDPSVFEPGRFEKLVYVPPPAEEDRLEILRDLTRDMPLAGDVSVEELAARTEGYSRADLVALCREAALAVLEELGEPGEVGMKHFEQAFGRVKPSITADLVKYYENWSIADNFRIPHKP